MITMSISKFKAHALMVIDQVAKNRENVIITKRGKPLAQVIPFTSSTEKNQPGKLAHTLTFEKDIISPLGEEPWDSYQ